MDITSVNTTVSTSVMRQKESLDKNQQMEKTAADFESFYVFQMLQETQPEVDLNNDYMGGEVEQTFRPILNQYLAEEIVKAGGVGLKQSILNQMQKYEEIEKNGK